MTTTTGGVTRTATIPSILLPHAEVSTEQIEVDVAVVGAGAAGTVRGAVRGAGGGRVALISAAPLAQTASYWAQGGLAAALAAEDSFELHLSDTERAGRGAVRRSAAEILVREAPERVHDLQALGVRFDADRFGRLALGLEGGHSVRRVVHAGGSATGRRLLRQLSALVVGEPTHTRCSRTRGRGRCGRRSRRTPRSPTDRSPAHPRCRGVLCEDGARAERTRGGVWAPAGRRRCGRARPTRRARRGWVCCWPTPSGAQLADLEFMQFHPTAVIGVRGREGFLITEAIRGEGATLHDANGERFVDELAPRDEVSRAIQARLRRRGRASVGLDMRAIDPALFPNVVGALREAGARSRRASWCRWRRRRTT